MKSSFSPQALLASLTGIDASAGLRVAYSGGMDSAVLLHVLAQLRDQLPGPLTAVHVDHGLQAEAAGWAEHCEHQCKRLGIPLARLSVDARPRRGESPEAAAREARYAAFAELLVAGELLLTAHHRDDQGETLLIQLLRGSGPRGLSAMPVQATLGCGTLLRPLLPFTRAELTDWAEQQGLRWIEDPSNRDLSLDRNFLRHQVMPLLASRWPTVERTLARAAGHQQDASELLDALAQSDLADVVDPGRDCLRADALQALCDGAGLARGRSLLRYWLRGHGLRPPAAVVLERVFTEMLPAGADRNPVVHWHGGEIRRYRGGLYALEPSGPDLSVDQARDWGLQGPLAFAGGQLSVTAVVGQGLRASACVNGVRVGVRGGGECCRPQRHRRSLKRLLQAAGIPPWRRQQLPLLSIDGELVQVVGLCIDQQWAAAPGEPGLLVCFERTAEQP